LSFYIFFFFVLLFNYYFSVKITPFFFSKNKKK